MKNLIIMAALTTAFSTGTFATHSEPFSETTKPKGCGFGGLVDINVNINLDSGLCPGELSKHLGRLVDIQLNFNNVDIGEICGQTQKPKPVANNGKKIANIAEGEPNGEDYSGKGDVIEVSEVTPYGIFKEKYEGSKQNIFEALEKFTGSPLNAYDVYTSIIFGKDFGGNGILIENTVAREDTDEKYSDKLVFLEKLITGFYPVWKQDEGAESQDDISSENIESVLKRMAGKLGFTFFSIIAQHPVEQPEAPEEVVETLLVKAATAKESVYIKEKKAPAAKAPVKKKEKAAKKKRDCAKKPMVQFDLSDSELDDSGLEYLFGDSE